MLLSSLEVTLRKVALSNAIIAGDFNGHNTMWGSERTNSRGSAIADFLSSHDFHLLNDGNEYTFYTIRDSRILKSKVDLTLISSSLLANNWSWKVDDLVTSSDHRCISFNSASNNNESHHSSTTRRWRTANVDWSSFDSEIISHENRWVRLFLNSNSPTILDSVVELFVRELTSICNSTLPLITPHKKRVPWWSSELSKLRSIARIWKNRFKRAVSSSLKQLYLTNYIVSKKSYVKAIFAAKRASWNKFLSTQDCHSVWQQAYKLCKSSRKVTPRSIRLADGSLARDSQMTAAHLINAFLPDDIPTVDTAIHRCTRYSATTASSSVLHDAATTTFTHASLQSIISPLSDKKAPGPDGFSANIIKHLFSSSPEVLLSLYNRCLTLGLFPTVLKRCRVIAIPKAGSLDSSLPKSWRPISLLSTLAKIFEKLWIDEIFRYLNSSSPLSPNQYGFTPHKSTHDAIDRAISFMRHVKSEKKYGALISLDVSSAFDEAWWPAVIMALIKRNVPPQLISLCSSYFSNRTATLTVGPSTVTKNISRGCPQGSSCGPGLWNILYDDVLRLSLPCGCESWAFADDLILAVAADSLIELQFSANMALQRIYSWGCDNKIRFNEAKTQVLPIHVRRLPDHPTFVMNNVVLQNVSSMRYLGVHLNSKLSWRTHLDYLSKKTLRVYSVFSRLAKNVYGLNPQVCTNIYKAAIEPSLLYAFSVWGSSSPRRWIISSLISLQRLYLLRAAKAYRTVSFEALCIMLDTPPIDLRAKFLLNFRRAKLVCQSLDVIPLIKQQLLDRIDAEWNVRWQVCSKGHTTKLFFPTLLDRRKALYFCPDFFTTQFISGHGKFREYLFKFKITDSNVCPCGEPQSSCHLLLSCPLLADIRSNVNPNSVQSLSSLFLSLSTSLSFTYFVKNIHDRLILWERSTPFSH